MGHQRIREQELARRDLGAQHVQPHLSAARHAAALETEALSACGIDGRAGDLGRADLVGFTFAQFICGTVLVLTMLWLLAPTLAYHPPMIP